MPVLVDLRVPGVGGRERGDAVADAAAEHGERPQRERRRHGERRRHLGDAAGGAGAAAAARRAREQEAGPNAAAPAVIATCSAVTPASPPRESAPGGPNSASEAASSAAPAPSPSASVRGARAATSSPGGSTCAAAVKATGRTRLNAALPVPERGRRRDRERARRRPARARAPRPPPGDEREEDGRREQDLEDVLVGGADRAPQDGRGEHGDDERRADAVGAAEQQRAEPGRRRHGEQADRHGQPCGDELELRPRGARPVGEPGGAAMTRSHSGGQSTTWPKGQFMAGSSQTLRPWRSRSAWSTWY